MLEIKKLSHLIKKVSYYYGIRIVFYSILITFSLSGTLKAQENDAFINILDSIAIYNSNIELEASKRLLELARAEINDQLDPHTRGRFNMENGKYLQQSNERDSAIYYLELAEQDFNEESPVDAILLSSVYGLLFSVYERSGKRDLAFASINKAIDLVEKTGTEKVPETGEYYKMQGVSYLYGGDIDNAQKCLLKSERYIKKYYPNNLTKLSSTKGTQLYLLLVTGNFDEAIKQYRAFLQKTKNVDLTIRDRLRLYIGYAIALRETKRYDEALDILHKGEILATNTSGPPNPGLGDIWNITTNIYMETKRYDKAEENILKTIDIRLKTADKNSYYTTEAYWTLGKLKLKQMDFDGAIKYYEKALQSTKYVFQDPSFFRAKKNYTSITNSLTYLTDGYVQRYLNKKEKKDLEKAYELSKESIYALEKIKAEFTMDGSKENIVKDAYSIYENAITVAYYAHQSDPSGTALEFALEIMEKSKMQSLQEKARSTAYNNTNKIPAGILKERDKIRSELIPIRESFAVDSLITPSLESSYLKLTSELEIINKNIISEYPQHYQYMLNQSTTTIEEVKNKLLNDSLAIVHYFITDSTLYSLVLSNIESNIYSTKLSKPISEQIDLFRKFTSESNLKEANIILEEFSKLLIRSIPEIKSFEKIKLIPHKELWFVPFEALSHSDGKELLYTNNVSFANTLSLLIHQKTIKSRGNNKVIAFAPKYVLNQLDNSPSTRAGLSPLAGAKAEVENIATIITTDAYLEEIATKENFVNNVSEYEILHLAMHNIIDSLGNPNLVFYKEGGDNIAKLSSSELISIDFKADLAVISACNTAYGKIQSGSGIRSMSHAFAYAGIPSTVMTLWKIPDETSSKIMTNFYENLAVGQTKDLALRNAKISYLEDDAIPEKLKTYDNWAGFVLEGNESAINLTNSINFLGWPGFSIGILLAGLAFFIFSRKK
jgi:CHAT domain-containing protein